MLSTRELDFVTRAAPPMRRAPRQPGAGRPVGIRVVPRSAIAARAAVGPTRGRVVAEYAAALLYGLPFYGVSCLAMVRAALRRRQQRMARRHADAATVDTGVGGRPLSA